MESSVKKWPCQPSFQFDSSPRDGSQTRKVKFHPSSCKDKLKENKEEDKREKSKRRKERRRERLERRDNTEEQEEFSLVTKGKEAAAFSLSLSGKGLLENKGDLSPCSNLLE